MFLILIIPIQVGHGRKSYGRPLPISLFSWFHNLIVEENKMQGETKMRFTTDNKKNKKLKWYTHIWDPNVLETRL